MNKNVLYYTINRAEPKATGLSIVSTLTDASKGEYTFNLRWTDVPDVLSTGNLEIEIRDNPSSTSTNVCKVRFLIYDVMPSTSLPAPGLTLCETSVIQHQTWKCQLVPALSPTDFNSETIFLSGELKNFYHTF